MLGRKNDLVNMKVPEEFRQLVDKKRVDEGYNNRERAKFLRDLCDDEDPFQKLKEPRKKNKSGGIDFGF